MMMRRERLRVLRESAFVLNAIQTEMRVIVAKIAKTAAPVMKASGSIAVAVILQEQERLGQARKLELCTERERSQAKRLIQNLAGDIQRAVTVRSG